MEQSPPHIAIVPSPGIGHLMPLVEFAKRLVHAHGFSVTFLIPTDSPPSSAAKSILAGLPSAIRHVFLPPIAFDDILQDNLRIETLISLTVSRSLPSLRAAFESLTAANPILALVVDLFSSDAFDVAAEFGVPPYIFFPSTAMMLSFFLQLPELDAAVSCEFRDMPEPVNIPGCIPINGSDLLDPVQDRTNDAYRTVLHHAKRFRMAEGVMVNTFAELERGAIKALQEEEKRPEMKTPPLYPVGPIIKMVDPNSAPGSNLKPGSECLKWLDEQPAGSVLFVSFGSGGALSQEQITELALGLEMSDQRFLWVARSPNNVANAAYFSAKSLDDPAQFLPNGFLDRVKDRAMVLPSWAPQAEVLAHGSTGGFLSHCGWNSTLESVVHGVPMIAWPLYAEQRMNAVMLSSDLKVAVRPKAAENGVVGREEIEMVVRSLMEGEEGKRVRSRMRELKEAAAKVVSEEGSSTRALAEVAHKWMAQRTRP